MRLLTRIIMKAEIIFKKKPLSPRPTGHRPQEQVFTIKSIMANYEKEEKVLILQEYDLLKFFDKVVRINVMDTLHGLGIDGKGYRT